MTVSSGACAFSPPNRDRNLQYRAIQRRILLINRPHSSIGENTSILREPICVTSQDQEQLCLNGTIRPDFAAKETLEHPDNKECVCKEVSLPEAARFVNESICPFHS